MGRLYHRVSVNLLFAVLLCVHSVFSQPSSNKDRLARMRDVTDSRELVMIWGLVTGSSDYRHHHCAALSTDRHSPLGNTSYGSAPNGKNICCDRSGECRNQ